MVLRYVLIKHTRVIVSQNRRLCHLLVMQMNGEGGFCLFVSYTFIHLFTGFISRSKPIPKPFSVCLMDFFFVKTPCRTIYYQ